MGCKICKGSWLEFEFLERTLMMMMMMMSLTWAISSVDVKRKLQLGYFIKGILLIDSNLKCVLFPKL